MQRTFGDISDPQSTLPYLSVRPSLRNSTNYKESKQSWVPILLNQPTYNFLPVQLFICAGRLQLPCHCAKNFYTRWYSHTYIHWHIPTSNCYCSRHTSGYTHTPSTVSILYIVFCIFLLHTPRRCPICCIKKVLQRNVQNAKGFSARVCE